MIIPLLTDTSYAKALGTLKSKVSKQTRDYKIVGTQLIKKNLLIKVSGHGKAEALDKELAAKVHSAQQRACVPVVAIYIENVEPDLREAVIKQLSQLSPPSASVYINHLRSIKLGGINVVDKRIAKRILTEKHITFGWSKCPIM